MIFMGTGMGSPVPPHARGYTLEGLVDVVHLRFPPRTRGFTCGDALYFRDVFESGDVVPSHARGCPRSENRRTGAPSGSPARAGMHLPPKGSLRTRGDLPAVLCAPTSNLRNSPCVGIPLQGRLGISNGGNLPTRWDFPPYGGPLYFLHIWRQRSLRIYLRLKRYLIFSQDPRTGVRS